MSQKYSKSTSYFPLLGKSVFLHASVWLYTSVGDGEDTDGA